MSTFSGLTAVVTGAGSGIGRALSYRLATEGAILAISDIDDLGLAETASHATGLGARVRADRLDVTDRDSVHGGDCLGMSFTDIERVVDVDFWGVVNGTKAFLPHLIRSGKGRLVNISSLFGLVPMAGQSAYVAAKYAVRGFTETVRIEMLAAGHPVMVTCVHPGGVQTAIARHGTVNSGADPVGNAEFFDRKLARTSPERAASLILRGAARGRPRVMIGADAWALHLVGSLSCRAWQRTAAYVVGRLDREQTGLK